MTIMTIAVTTLAILLGLVLLSYVVEVLRPRPRRPERLAWAPDLEILYADVDGVSVRYVKSGSGPALVLLHTLRTQLDIFQKLIPELARHYTVYACDYPGHGWSDIPRADYAPEDFYRWTAAFLEGADIEGATVAGISIGATIALVLAARRHPRIARVIAVNPYDYGPPAGVRSSSLVASVILTPAEVPILGATVMRLRNRVVNDLIMAGGVATRRALPPALARELNEVGARPGHYRAFLQLLRYEGLWPDAREEYPNIRIPVLLVYGEQDWAPVPARERDRALIPGVTVETVPGGGHFLSLDQPGELQRLILAFAPER
jgi:pimeloyl-ACP methyl ester carboxylesterase